MPRLKYFNNTTQEWEYVIVGGQGPQGDTGPGLAAGGTAGQIIAKVDGTDYNTEWIDNYTSQVKHLVKAGESLTKGQAVYVSSANGTNMIVSKASNATESTASKTMGIVAQDLTANAEGFVITEGLISGLNTSTATAGDPVWLGTSGNLIYGASNKPVAPVHMVFLGFVTRVNSNNGEIFVKVQNGFELEELHDVSITSPAAGELVVRNSANTLWENQTPAEAGLSEIGHTHDDRYYTETETNTLLNAKANLASPSFTGDVSSAGKLFLNASNGDEGGELFLSKAATNTTLNSGVNIDIWQDRLRIFESGGNARGYYLDIAKGANAVGTNLSPGLSPIIPSSVIVSGGSASTAADGTVTFSGVSAITLKNVFSADIEHNKFIMTLSSASNDADMMMQFGKTGLSNLSSGFYWGRYAVYAGPNSGASFTANTGGGMFARISAGGGFASGDITGAASTRRKAWNSISADQDFMIFFAGRNSTGTAYEDIYLYLLQGGTFSGTFKILGYK